MRDLRDLLEAHWARTGAEEYEAERPLFGDLDSLSASKGDAVRVPARGGATGGDLLTILERVRADRPDDPFWKGVRALHPGADALEIVWNEPREPRLVESGPVEVECHLYG
jgi:peptide/nickel transport system ATP-binding protein